MEIERKWLVSGWPEDSNLSAVTLPLVREQTMRQGYITVRPTVRIREESETGGNTEHILCFKSSGTADGLAREEIEIAITPEHFAQLEGLIGIPLIPKVRRTYQLPDGLHLEVNLVDRGAPTEFMYAEVEFASEDQAKAWLPASAGLAPYLKEEVTGQPGQTMGAYWAATRLHGPA